MTVSLHATSRDGSTATLPVGDASSVMEVLRDAAFGDVLALCGGCCSCATCHVYVAEEDFALFAPPSEDELDLLDSSDSREPGSRLSCQLRLNEVARDVSVRIAPQD